MLVTPLKQGVNGITAARCISAANRSWQSGYGKPRHLNYLLCKTREFSSARFQTGKRWEYDIIVG